MANKGKKKINKNTMKKDINKEKKKIEKIEPTNSDGLWHGFIVVCAIIIFICLFYILAVHITNKNGETTKKKDKSDVSISYSEIIVGRTLSMSDKEYLVVLYDKSNSDISQSINEYINKYNGKKKHLNVYSVDMSTGLNKKYNGDSSNTNPKKESEIVVNGPTLIKVKKGKVVDYIEGIDDISNYLN